MPSRQYEDGDGKKKYFAYLKLEDEEQQKRFSATVIEKFDEWEAKQMPEQLELFQNSNAPPF